jgi:hypothetical protein
MVAYMINQERVREMSRMSMLESGIGEKELRISEYRRVDYVILQMVKGFVAGSICFAALFLLWFFYIWDDLNQFFANADFERFAEDVLVRYGIFMVIYLIISAVAAIKHHKRCSKRKLMYMSYLNRLNRSYRSGEAAQTEGWRE